MPVNIKISISVIVAMVGMGVFFLEQRFGDMAVGVIALLLALFMILLVSVAWPVELEREVEGESSDSSEDVS